MKRHSRIIFQLQILFLLLISLVSSVICVSPVSAAGIVVNSASDVVAEDGLCTLREAITAANNDTASGGCPAGFGTDTITFAGNYTITLSGKQLPVIATQIHITGNGPANTILQANASLDTATYRVFEVGSPGNLVLDQVTVRHGNCSSTPCGKEYYPGYFNYDGGGIYNAGILTVVNSNIWGNRAKNSGGAIANKGTLTIMSSILSKNEAKDDGGGVSNQGTMTITNSTISDNSTSWGGGMRNEGTLTLTNSILSGNSATTGGGIDNSGNVTVINSTLSNNLVLSEGGAISNYGAGSVTITNGTLSENEAGEGGGIDNFTGTVELINTLLAQNTGGNCSGPLPKITDGGNNLDSDGTCGLSSANGSITNIDAKVGPLAYHGGPTQTHALLADSPATDQGDDTSCPGTDQRGVSRSRGLHCDIGAYEVAYPIIPTFTDVSTGTLFWQDIEVLYANGLTGGCKTSPLKFCPGDLMNRAQAAVFMVRGAHGAGYVPNPTKYLFQDSWSGASYARPWAEAMRETNLTTGCKASPLLYCPLTQLNREQAVIFGLKMKYGTTYQPPPATGTVFADMTNPNYWATPWAEKAYADGLIQKCDIDPVSLKPLFCPTVKVTRGLAAYIIVRAKSLTMP